MVAYLKKVRRTCSLLALALFLSILYSVGARAEGMVNISIGERVFTARCVACHGARGVGTDSGPPLVHKIYRPSHHGDFSFNLAVTRGVRAHHWKFGDMKKVEGVTRAEIEAIIAYVRALQREAGID